MVNIIRARTRPRVHVLLRKLEKTSNCWLFTFADPYNRFQKKVLLPFTADWETAEWMWDKVHEEFLEEARRKQWEGN